MATSCGSSSASSVLASSSGLDSESDSETEASNTSSSTVSILDRLKAPRQSDLARKRKVAANPPPLGKRCSCKSQLIMGHNGKHVRAL